MSLKRARDAFIAEAKAFGMETPESNGLIAFMGFDVLENCGYTKNLKDRKQCETWEIQLLVEHMTAQHFLAAPFTNDWVDFYFDLRDKCGNNCEEFKDSYLYVSKSITLDPVCLKCVLSIRTAISESLNKTKLHIKDLHDIVFDYLFLVEG